MKVETKHVINGEVVTQSFKTQSVTFYSTNNNYPGEDKHYVVNNKTGAVECIIDVNPCTGEGGGGSIDFEEVE